MIKNKKLNDPLDEIAIPSLFPRLNINHHSPTSLNYPDGIWFFRYGICTQEERRMFDGNSMMAAGVAVNNAIQDYIADEIWKLNPLTKKLAKVKNEKLSKEDSLKKALNEYRKYKPCNDKDQEKFEHYLNTIPDTISHGYAALQELGVSTATICEDTLSLQDERLLLPFVGRSDVETNNKPLSSSHPAENLLSRQVIEIKTSWQKLMKLKKDGTRSFSCARLPSQPSKPHLAQIAFYATARPKAEPKLLYITADGYKIFTKHNCVEMKPENLKKYYEQSVRTAMRRERLLSRYENINSIETIKAELVKDLDPQFDHNFYWNIGQMWVDRAKEIWS